MEKYGKFQAIDLTSTSTQSSQSNYVLDVASNSQPEISPIMAAISSEFQNKSENLNSQGLKENVQEVGAKPSAAAEKLQLDDSDVIIIDDETADPPPTVVEPEIHQKTTKSIPLAEKILRILEVSKSPLILTEIQEQVGSTYDRKLLEKLLQEQASQGKVLVKTYSKLPIYCFNNKIKAETVSGKRFFDSIL